MVLRIKRENCKVGHKKIDHLLSAIRRRSVLDARFILGVSRTKYATEIFRLIKSLDDDYIITESYSTTGIRKNKRINLSHGRFLRQSSRRCHIFLVLDKNDKEN